LLTGAYFLKTIKFMITTGTKVKHVNYGKGTVVKVEDILYKIDFGSRGVLDISKRSAEELLEVLEEETSSGGSEEISISHLEKTLIRVLNQYSDIQQVVELGDKWLGGTMILKPGTESLKPKEIPIETFFHKIVMLRDRLRVLEQNINSNPKLTDEDKVGMQQYITRIYGSLTTFNVLFKDQDDYFVGEKKS